MSRRLFDTAFKKMALELSYARGSVKEAAAELGIDPGRITKWRLQHQGPGEKPITALTEEQKEIRWLQKALKEAQLERDILKKAVSISRIESGILDSQGRRAIFGFIKEHRNLFPVEKMCLVLKVSTSGYYYWLQHPNGLRASKEQQLLAVVKKVYQQSDGCYGSPRIAVELREQGIKASRPRIARLMRKHAIRSIIRRKYRVQTTDSNHGFAIAENYLNRNFSITRLRCV